MEILARVMFRTYNPIWFLSHHNFISPCMTKLKDRLKLLPLPTLLGKASAILVTLLIVLYSVWYTSVGQFPTFPNYTDNGYTNLGEAFLHGQLSLLSKPDPKLISLQNPYDYEQYIKVPFERDNSYYQGNYYLYWGPIPGVISAGIEGITHIRPPDALLVVISYMGLSFLLLINLMKIRDRFFRGAPSFSLTLFMLSGLVNIPFLFLLGRPEVYETSIIVGQLFLVVGLSSWMAYTETSKPFWLLIAGLGWGLALGSRYNLVISIAVFVSFIIVWIGQEGQWKHFGGKVWLLLAPLALCILGLGIYNFARFHNPFETGLTYQLTNPIKHFFLASYLPSNFYSYFFYPLNVTSRFPFIGIYHFSDTKLPIWLRYSADSLGKRFDPVMAGLLPSTPSTWLLALGIPLAVLLGTSYRRRRPALSNRFAFLALILTACMVQVFFLLIFFYGAMRYLADFYLLLTLIVAMIVWRIDETIQSRPRLRICLWVIVTGLVLGTSGMGLFGGFDIPPQIFQHYNPVLYSHLASYWNNCYQGLKTIIHTLWIPKILHFVLHGAG